MDWKEQSELRKQWIKDLKKKGVDPKKLTDTTYPKKNLIIKYF